GDLIGSSNVSNPAANSSAQLLDTGSLVLRDNSGERIIWEKFSKAFRLILQKMRIASPLGQAFEHPTTFVWNGGRPYWRSGPWNGQNFIGIPTMDSSYLAGFTLVDDTRRNRFSSSYTYQLICPIYIYLLLNSEGDLQKNWCLVGKEEWEVAWSAIEHECDVYGKCGPLESVIHWSHQFVPLRDLGPKHMDEWSQGNWSSGCIRKTTLQCERNKTVNEVGKEDGFLKLQAMKALDVCNGGSLLDIQKLPRGAVDLYIRVAYSELDEGKNIKVKLAVIISIGSVAIAICTYISWRWIAKLRGRKQKPEAHPDDPTESMLRDKTHLIKLEELPLFSFENLAKATDNFHGANKLGQGGFGPVYKVMVVYLGLHGILNHMQLI
ncbi:unnamed protein product, partial [Ilex paraguariensis]